MTRGASAGLGSDIRLKGPGVLGSGLEFAGETIQLSAYTAIEHVPPTTDGGSSAA